MAIDSKGFCFQATINATSGLPSIRQVGPIETAPADQCDYILPSTAAYMQLQAASSNFMEWFHFDATDALGFFAVGLTLWATGIKIGAVVRTIFYTRR